MDKPFSGSKLETNYKPTFDAWKADPTPATTGALLKAIDPEIERGISAHVGASHPLIKSRARQIALGALRSYDPKQAKLGTHMVNQLQGLRRVARQQTNILAIPERVQLDQAFLSQEENSLRDELGRDPSTAELSDRTGLSLRRITKIRSYKNPVSEGYFSSSDSEENPAYIPAVQHSSKAWVETVYTDLDPVNQKIMEWTLGLHGVRPLSNQEIARRLGVTPGAITQRKFQIQALMNQEQELSPF
jgi:DNA-directed RNA polymerase specialized sigma subunit